MDHDMELIVKEETKNNNNSGAQTKQKFVLKSIH